MSTQTDARGAEFRADVRQTSPRSLPADLLSELTRLDPWRAYSSIALTAAILTITLGLALLFWTPWVVVPAMLIVATQQHAMFVLAHDAAHYRISANRTVNDFLGRAIGALGGISMCSYRVIHRLHHNHLYGDNDPDVALHGGYPRGRRYLVRKLLTDLAGFTAWKNYKYFFGAPALNIARGVAQRPLDDTAPVLRQSALHDRRMVIAVQVALPVFVFGAFGLDGLVKYVVLWIVPALTLLQAMLRLRAIAEHGAPAGVDSPLRAARTNLANPLVRLALFPHHVNFHIEHHLYPAVPHYNLPRLHAELAARHGLDGAEVRSFGATWRRVYADRAPRTA